MKILEQYGLEITIPSPNDRQRTPDVMIFRGKSRFVDEVHIPMPNSDPVQNYSLNFRKQKEENLAWDSRKTGIQETGAARVTFQTSVKETCADTLSISPSQATFFTPGTIPTTERKWKVTHANSSYGGALSIAVSKMVTRMVRHYDQKMNDNLTQHFTGTR